VVDLAANELFQKGVMNPVMVRWGAGIATTTALILLYLFQNTNFASLIDINGQTAQFVFNKTFRFLANDLLMIGLIFSLFAQRRFVLFALVVQVAGVIFILLPYFVLKLYFHTGNGPLVSFLHRLILNPTLMILLIPAFWLQTRNETKS
jgi:exosortase F-associated protein